MMGKMMEKMEEILRKVVEDGDAGKEKMENFGCLERKDGRVCTLGENRGMFTLALLRPLLRCVLEELLRLLLDSNFSRFYSN